MSVLKIENFTKIYGGTHKAVDNLSLDIEAGDIYGFIGHNGAGKSTTIKAACGVIDITDGEIYIDGHSVKKEPVYCKSITAFIPDNPDIYSYLTGFQYLNFIGDVFGTKQEERKELIKKYATIFEIEKNLGDLISSYSHGMRQKLVIISALIHKPKLLIMDEPFVGLDPKATHSMKEIMAEICANGGAIFFSTHVLEVAEKLCNKIAIIKGGKLVASGKTQDILGDKSLEDIFMEIYSDDKEKKPEEKAEEKAVDKK